jgi:uncharacterized membrane protein YfcA
MTLHEWLQLLAVFVVGSISSVFSGMAGGGGGFILTPFYIWLGLTPQQTVATGKFGSFGMTAGAVVAFKKRMLEDRRFSLFLIILSAAVGLLAAQLLQNVDNSWLQRSMGIVMLAMVPFMLQKSRGIHRRSPTRLTEVAGTLSLIIIMLLQGILGNGIGSLVPAMLMLFFGRTALEANILKRKTSIALNGVLVLGLLGSGLINFKFGFAAMAGGLLGGYIGSHIALKNGENFAKYAILVFMIVSGFWLLLTA